MNQTVCSRCALFEKIRSIVRKNRLIVLAKIVQRRTGFAPVFAVGYLTVKLIRLLAGTIRARTQAVVRYLNCDLGNEFSKCPALEFD